MTITSVVQRPSGWWIVTDSTGEQHGTKSAWMASLAQRLHEKEAEVAILSFRGWSFRELRNITEIKTKELAS